MIETVILMWVANRVACPFWLNIVLGFILICKIINFISYAIHKPFVQISLEEVKEDKKDDFQD